MTTGSGVSDIVAINDHQFLADERDGKGLGDGSDARIKQIFKIDVANATDITDLTGAAAAAAVPKSATPFLDIVAVLGAHGITPANVPEKIEGPAFGPDLVLADGTIEHTLWVTNDNDFVPGTAGPNQFYVFGFQDSDLSSLAPNVPEPLHGR